jgi:chemotaxis protein CheZ
MSKSNPPSPLRASDYEALESALLGSTRGRWFLSEYSRRNRSADTQMLLDAITKLEGAFVRQSMDGHSDRIRHELIEMSEAISQTRREIAAIKAPHEESRLVSATEELDAIVKSTEKATSDILEAAEDVQETAWVLREKGVDSDTCDRLDQRATDIYTACSFQDITGQRTGKVVDVLRYLEKRVNSMVDIWGLEDLHIRESTIDNNRPDAHLLNGPQRDGHGLEQSDIDSMIAEDSMDAADFSAVQAPQMASDPATPAMAMHEPEAGEQILEALDISSLDDTKAGALFS